LHSVSNHEALTAVSHHLHHHLEKIRAILRVSEFSQVTERTGDVAPRVWAGETQGFVNINLQLALQLRSSCGVGLLRGGLMSASPE
jgi:hypothetical protein